VKHNQDSKNPPTLTGRRAFSRKNTLLTLRPDARAAVGLFTSGLLFQAALASGID